MQYQKSLRLKGRQRHQDELIDWIKELRASDYIVVVEGKKDKKCLEELGINSIELKGMPLYKIIENILESSKTNKKCVILTDLDKEGRKIFSKLNSKLQMSGIKVCNNFREFLFKTSIRQIEGLRSYREKLGCRIS